MRFGLIVAAAMMLAPAARAQESGCPLLQKIVGGAPAGFPELRGDELDNGWFDTGLYMNDADDCAVKIGDHNLFYCAWWFDTPAAANTLATALSGAATQCLAGWTLEETTGQKSSNNLVVLKGVTLSGAGAHAGTHILVFSESLEDSQESQVTIEVRR